MDPKDIVLRAIERRGPPRTPIHYCNRDFEFSDTHSVSCAPAEGFTPSVAGLTEWGTVWHTLNDTMGQPEVRPLADWSQIERYAPPDPCASGRFARLAGDIARNPDKFVKFCLGITGFNVATFLRGFEDFLVDLYLAPERAGRVLDIVFGYEQAIIERALTYPIDAVTFGDDWGTQQGLMIAPELWREVFAPRYRAQFSRVHAAGKKVWFHTCGNVRAVLGDLIACGVDVLELLQPDIYGVERLAAEFGGRVCFCCSVDHQRLAISGTREEILAYVRLLRDTLGAFNGGFIGYIEDYASLGMSERTYQWIREAFHSLDDRQLPV